MQLDQYTRETEKYWHWKKNKNRRTRKGRSLRLTHFWSINGNKILKSKGNWQVSKDRSRTWQMSFIFHILVKEVSLQTV